MYGQYGDPMQACTNDVATTFNDCVNPCLNTPDQEKRERDGAEQIMRQIKERLEQKMKNKDIQSNSVEVRS